MAEALLNTRRGHRSFVTKLINSATSLMEDFDEQNQFKLMNTKTSLSKNFQKLETLDEQILSRRRKNNQ